MTAKHLRRSFGWAPLVGVLAMLVGANNATAQQIGSQRWVQVSPQYWCSMQFNGRGWVNVGGCHVMPAQQQTKIGTAKLVQYGQRYCPMRFSGQQWTSAGSCLNAQEKVALDKVTAEVQAIVAKDPAAIARYNAMILAQQQARQQQVSPELQRIREANNRQTNEQNRLAEQVGANGVISQINRQADASRADATNRQSEAMQDRNNAERAWRTGQGNAPGLETRARNSANR